MKKQQWSRALIHNCIGLITFSFLASSTAIAENIFRSMSEMHDHAYREKKTFDYLALNPMLRLPKDVEAAILDVTDGSKILGMAWAVYKSTDARDFLFVRVTAESKRDSNVGQDRSPFDFEGAYHQAYVIARTYGQNPEIEIYRLDSLPGWSSVGALIRGCSTARRSKN